MSYYSAKYTNALYEQVIIKLCCRSAPASPSHMNMTGTLTPDSFSREGSPVADQDSNDQPPQVTVVAPQAQFAPPSTIPHDIRYSQSAPGSPSGTTPTSNLIAALSHSTLSQSHSGKICVTDSHSLMIQAKELVNEWKSSVAVIFNM